jgi:hypothetical protein
MNIWSSRISSVGLVFCLFLTACSGGSLPSVSHNSSDSAGVGSGKSMFVGSCTPDACPSITISAHSVSGNSGTEQTLTYSCHKGDILYGCSPAISSSNAAVATASLGYVVKTSTTTIVFLAPGPATLTYSWQGATASVAVNVSSPPTSYGVGVPFPNATAPGPTAAEIAMLQHLGVTSVRIGMGKPGGTAPTFDPNSGQEEWVSPAVQQYKSLGYKVLAIAPSITAGTPFNTALVTQYAAEVAAIAPSVWMLELQNEPDISYVGEEQLTSAQYITLATAMAQAARAANPLILISSGGTSGYDTTWLSETVPSLLPYIDCVGVHPYGLTPPFNGLETQVEQSYGRPMCMTEWGLSQVPVPTLTQVTVGASSSNGLVPAYNYNSVDALIASPSYAAAYMAGI